MDFELVDELSWRNEEQLCEKINKMSYQEFGLEVSNNRLLTYVHASAAHGFEDSMQCIFNLVKSESNISQLINYYNLEGWNALMQSARYGQTSIFNCILKFCQNIDACSNLGTTALLCATRSGHLSAVKMLLDEGADICNIHYSELTPLMVAAQHGYDAIVKELLKRGCDINFQSKSAELTALMLAVSNGHVTTVNILIAMGADVRIANKANLTALDISVSKRKKKLELILKNAINLADDNAGTSNSKIKEVNLPEIDKINKDAELTEKKPWWNPVASLLKIQKKCDGYKSEIKDLKYFSSTNNLTNSNFKSSNCVADIPVAPNLGPCKLSQVKQTLQSRMEMFRPSFDDEFCPYFMPSVVGTTHTRASLNKTKFKLAFDKC